MADAVELRPIQSGIRMRLRVKPGARRSRLVGAHGGALKLEVTAPPERGKANTAVEKLLARTLGLKRADVTITSGHASQDKVVEVTGATGEDLIRRLADTGVTAVVSVDG